MEKLYNKRRSQHFLLLLRYWRLVFNDHFMIALFVFLGALIWGYSQALDQLTPPIWWARPITIVILLILLQFGRLATLLKPADPVFLLPQSKMMDHYLKQAARYSLLLAELIVVGCTVIVMPFLMSATQTTNWQAGIIIITVMLLKYSWMDFSLLRLYRRNFQQNSIKWLLQWGCPAIILIVTLLVNAIAGMVLALLLLVFTKYQLSQLKHQLFNWRLAVATESQRMLGVYRFFNLFTDVPAVQGTIHRRKYLDFMLTFLNRDKTVFSYLYARGLLRGTEVSGLIVRLTLIGMVIVFFVPEFWLNLILFLLFIYLIAVQIMPFYWQYDSHVFTYLYPIKVETKMKSFKKMMVKIMAIVGGLLWLASLTTQISLTGMGIKLILGILEIWLLGGVYATSRINNKKSK
ncbi:ABC transporter permease [Paucilactobacillus wasatchensis]|uniref:ABC transporter, permease protein n=1 Tax=Paucilactobacillus wasatchensis TaxID=1335616 RepID=A0A0D1ABL1_9LACO|nr:ABC transporter permease [Paucilactobacillus wasatchensis]KIS04066.1 ABC transporter, permease protein [Paucilactobacillus wasatchensis]